MSDLKAKMYQNRFRFRAYNAPPAPKLDLRGPTSKGKGGVHGRGGARVGKGKKGGKWRERARGRKGKKEGKGRGSGGKEREREASGAAAFNG